MALDTFLYDNTTIRTAGTIANPLFCLSDVCGILDITNISNKAAKLCDDEKQAVSVQAADGKIRLLTFVNEVGL